MAYNYDTGAFRGYCVLCGDGHSKREMNCVLVRFGSYGSPKTMAYVCQNCTPKVADWLGVELPDEEERHRKLYDYPRCQHCQTRVKTTDRYCWYCGNGLRSAKEHKA